MKTKEKKTAKANKEQDFLKSLKRLQASFKKADKERQKKILNDPNNGKRGLWEVDGIRHAAIVRATSAMEAIELAKDIVGNWEMPTAEYIGPEMPDVRKVR